MDKKLVVYICITTISLVGTFVFASLYYDHYRFISQDGEVFDSDSAGLIRAPDPYKRYIRPERSGQSRVDSPAITLIAGICGLLLLGYLLKICYEKFTVDSKAESVDFASALHKIALESGQTEYELFVIAAEKWSISKAQIDKDFKNYMAANVLPYYVMDLVRKNDERIDKSLEKERKTEPVSWWDMAKALLIFPGGFIIPYFLLLIFRPYFFRY